MQYLKEGLSRIDEGWAAARFDSLPHVVHILTSKDRDGEIQFLVTDLRPWFVDKYRLILTNLSRYDIVDFNKDTGVRCPSGFKS